MKFHNIDMQGKLFLEEVDTVMINPTGWERRIVFDPNMGVDGEVFFSDGVRWIGCVYTPPTIHGLPAVLVPYGMPTTLVSGDVGKAVHFNGTTWELADGNDETKLANGLLYEYVDSIDYTIIVAGFMNGLSGLTPDSWYVPNTGGSIGELTRADIAPGLNFDYANLIFYATATNNGLVMPYVPLRHSVRLSSSASAITSVSELGVKNAIEALIGTAPGILDTLGEIADSIEDVADFFNTVAHVPTNTTAGYIPEWETTVIGSGVKTLKNGFAITTTAFCPGDNNTLATTNAICLAITAAIGSMTLPHTTSGLTSLNGGNTPDDYYHLTTTQHTDLTDNGNCSIHKHDDLYEQNHNDFGDLNGGGPSDIPPGYYHLKLQDYNTLANGDGGSTSDADLLHHHDQYLTSIGDHQHTHDLGVNGFTLLQGGKNSPVEYYHMTKEMYNIICNGDGGVIEPASQFHRHSGSYDDWTSLIGTYTSGTYVFNRANIDGLHILDLSATLITIYLPYAPGSGGTPFADPQDIGAKVYFVTKNSKANPNKVHIRAGSGTTIWGQNEPSEVVSLLFNNSQSYDVQTPCYFQLIKDGTSYYWKFHGVSDMDTGQDAWDFA